METTQVEQTLDFKIFGGPNYRQMPKLIAEGLVPAGAAQIMRGCLEGKLSFDACYDSGDAIVYHPDGRVKLVWDSQDLRKLNPESSLKGGALVLPAGAWESIDGEEFSKEEIARYTGKRQSEDNAKGNPFWQWLARNDQDLLGEYANQMFDRVKQRYCYNNDEAMGVYISNNLQRDAAVLRQWCLGVHGYGFAYGYFLLNDDHGHLVGVGSAGGAQSIEGAARLRRAKNDGPYHEPSYPQRPSLEEVLAFGSEYVPQVVQAEFEEGLRRLYQK